MGAVVPFARPAAPEPPEQWGEGPAFCLSCKHTWEAVAPTGVVNLECPACQRMTGHFKFEYAPAPGQLVRECRCGNELFYLTPQGHMCANCGTYQSYD